jgi:hypothetical protein
MSKHNSVSIICVLFIITLRYATIAQVVPVKWDAFTKANPTDSLSLMERAILLNANKYALTSWYNDDKKFGSQTNNYLDLGGIDEHNIRPVGSEALALAVSLKTNAYDEQVTGISKSKATGICLKLIRSVARHHKANEPGGWGEAWQSALWAAYNGAAGYIMWNELVADDKNYVQKMVEFEANRLNNYTVPYMRDKAGKVLIKGDSKSEENSWNAMIFHVALAMMPKHPNAKIWSDKNIELLLSANVRPQDVNSREEFNGKVLGEIVKGSNLNENGTITNHDRIHPDYMACVSQPFFNVLMFALAQKPAPKAAFYNADVIYKTMMDFKFPSPPYLKPGGSIYIEGTANVYYPETNDWGQGRKMHFALMDCEMAAFKLDKGRSHSGNYWEAYHARAVLNMQKRSTDGQTYQAVNEDTYKSREEWIAIHAAQAWLTKWLTAQHKFKVTNKAY